MIRKDLWIEELVNIYGDENLAMKIADSFEHRFAPYANQSSSDIKNNGNDAILITYGDTISDGKNPPLKVLDTFMTEKVGSAISTIHLLPMCPYTSDDGFSVVDYYKINPDLGSWDDIDALRSHFGLMFDAVLNHSSVSCPWFKGFVAGEKEYDDFYISADPNADYSSITRPRALPLLTEFNTVRGKEYIWTTFSTDQVDLNYRNPKVLEQVLDILLFYASRGAKFIRLDAIGFIWKELGTTSMHLPQTHAIIRLSRLILEDFFPETRIVTETNVPQKDNLSYLGNGNNEAHMIYQFPLPPLTMFTMLTEDATHIKKWISELPDVGSNACFFNFLSSHDGIGIRPVEGILSEEERNLLVEATLRNGGEVSLKDNGDGTKSPYELNINYQDALASPMDSDEKRIGRFLAAETILMSLKGIPGIYIHSLLGSRNDYMGKTLSGIPRRINREKLSYDAVIRDLESDTNRRKIFDEMVRRLEIRRTCPAFSISASERVLESDRRIIALLRECVEARVLFIQNVSSDTVEYELEGHGVDLLSGNEKNGKISIAPYESFWIELA